VNQAAREPLSDEREKRIRERESKATAGPWELRSIMGREYDTLSCAYDLPGEEPLDEWTPVLEIMELPRDEVYANWKFVAHAREDIPALLAEIDRLRLAVEFAIAALVCDTPKVKEALGILREVEPSE